jgi:hypothetical protein
MVISLGISSAFVRFEALMLGLVSAALVLITYHFKMVGFGRIQVAMGGINLGIGAFVISLAFLYQTNVLLFSVATLFEGVLFWGLLFVGGVFILAGILDVSIEE